MAQGSHVVVQGVRQRHLSTKICKMAAPARTVIRQLLQKQVCFRDFHLLCSHKLVNIVTVIDISEVFFR